jgi:hypothetical protein
VLKSKKNHKKKKKKKCKKMGPYPGCADSRTAIGHVVFSLCAHKHFYC